MFRKLGTFQQLSVDDCFKKRRFAAVLFLTMLLLFCMNPVKKNGDFAEYGVTTIAFASHGTPDIRLSDIQKAKRLNPEPFFSTFYEGLAEGMRAHALTPAVAFYRGNDANYYSIHFFAYSAIAALPFAIFDATGIPPFKCYQFVNLAFVYLLGIACLRFFGSTRRAATAVGLFLLCGGILYLDWSSPEVMTAACLLVGLVLQLANTPVSAGMVAGLASMQNPPLVLFAAFAPALHIFYLRDQGNTWRTAWALAMSVRYMAALAIFALLFIFPLLFNLNKFSVPSLIAAGTTDPRLISGARLFSFFFDLNQGMIIGVPALFLALAWILFNAKTGSMRLLTCTVLIFSVGMAIPALSTQNWNSGAAGMMRYAFWAAMPILFACLLQAKRKTLPTALIGVLFMMQAGATWIGRTYRHVEFSPLASFALANIPSLYNPVFEIFAERLLHREGFVSKEEVLSFKMNNQLTKIAFNLNHRDKASMKICGKNRELSFDAGVSVVDAGWIYLNTTPVCIPKLTEVLVFTAENFGGASPIKLTRGWGGLEFGGANWDGSWTVAPVAQFEIRLPADMLFTTLTPCGQYVGRGMETDILVNGHSLGRHALDRCLPISVPADFQKSAGRSIVELRHVPGNLPVTAKSDPRQLGFFLAKITLQ
jgi:hypothetical protein